MDYKAKRTRNLYNSFDEKPYQLSRSKVELFIECPYCFYMDRKMGVARPPSYLFNLNLAVDHLLKKEFDLYRNENKAHPIMSTVNKDILPFSHKELNNWRENFSGIRYHHQDTNLLLTGAVDDVWQLRDELIIVDYKATSSEYNLTYKSEKYDRYKRQLDFYSYLFKQNSFNVYKDALFLVCNGKKDPPRFDNCLTFESKIISHKIDTSWIEETLFSLFETLNERAPPKPSDTCHFCAYSAAKGS